MEETAWTPESETYSHEGPQCPHCGRQYTADDPWYYDEQNCTSETCDECGKPFSVSVSTPARLGPVRPSKRCPRRS